MCRFIAYIGKPIIIDDILTKPKNSLIRQSIRARETDEPLNGDGFGVGWYAPEIDLTPALFTSIQPAWNDRNLMYIAPKLRTNCFFAHVRAASAGGVSIFNCHPFQYNRFLFMHNGDIGNFAKIKRYLRRDLSDATYDWIKGQTDSEHFCALLIDIFEKNHYHFTAANMATSIKKALTRVEQLQKQYKAEGPNFINAVITDGKSIAAIRFSSDPNQPAPTLYYSEGAQYEYYEGASHMLPAEDGQNGAILIASEKLTNCKAEWKEIPPNHLLLVNEDFSTELEKVKAD